VNVHVSLFLEIWVQFHMFSTFHKLCHRMCWMYILLHLATFVPDCIMESTYWQILKIEMFECFIEQHQPKRNR